LYLGTAHVSLALAFALVGADPLAVAGFFYHSRMVAIVHLITIGWIAMSILGNVYVAVPMVLGRPFPARAGDYWAYVLAVIGLIGMVAHFWLAEFSGMAWSAATAAAGIAYVAVRLMWILPAARVPGGVKLHLYFASLNVLGAITMGVLLGFNKVYQFLGGYVLSNVFAHAHLAAIGWVCMMVVGFAYRMLPMLIPAASPARRTIYVSAVLLEIGIAGLFVTLVMRSALAALFALTIVAGFVAAGAHVVWMVNRQRPPSPERTRSAIAMAHVATAAAWLVLACVFGVLLTLAPLSEMTLRAAMLYGVFGLVGFLAQIILGFALHILPAMAAYWAIDQRGGVRPGQRAVSSVRGRLVIYCAWLGGVPAIAAGLLFTAPVLLSTGAWLLFAAVVLAGVDTASIVRRPTRATQ
jgi:cbb3-type cytochrome oxidase subunit 1